MGIRVVGLGMGVVALLTAGGVGAQPIAMQGDPSACQAAVGPLASVCAAGPADSQPAGGFSYRALLGHGQERFTRNPTQLDDNWWAALLRRAQHSFTAVASRLTSTDASRTAQGPSGVDGAQSDGFVPSTPATERFLIDEWQQSEVAVADSVYHETLQRIAATFDSTERCRVRDPERTRILRHLDAMLIATNDTWATFRSQIAARADSALANHDLTAAATK